MSLVVCVIPCHVTAVVNLDNEDKLLTNAKKTFSLERWHRPTNVILRIWAYSVNYSVFDSFNISHQYNNLKCK